MIKFKAGCFAEAESTLMHMSYLTKMGQSSQQIFLQVW